MAGMDVQWSFQEPGGVVRWEETSRGGASGCLVSHRSLDHFSFIMGSRGPGGQ